MTPELEGRGLHLPATDLGEMQRGAKRRRLFSGEAEDGYPGARVPEQVATHQVTFLGNYAFTALDGTRYQVNNVSITEPGSRYGGDNTLTTYMSVSRPDPPSARVAWETRAPGPP